MASFTDLDVRGSYVNGSIINLKEEEVLNGDPFTNLKNFINTYRKDIQVLNIYKCCHSAGSMFGPNCNDLFKNCLNLKEVHILENEYYGGVTNVSNMFYNCYNLTTITMPNWTMSNVANMSDMFYNCRELINLDVSNWNTSNVINISNMFYNCYNLTSFNVSNWSMSNVTNMAQVFRDCKSITSLNISNWNTENTTNINRIFYNCYNLISLNLSNWKTNNIIDSYGTFGNCRKLTSVNISDWNFNSMENIGLMFYNCINLTSLNLSNWQVSNITNMSYLFRDCHNLKTIHINPNNWKLNSSLVSGNMFINCYNLLGRKGTTYVSSKTDASYARIDGGPELPGYFCGIYNAAVSNIPIKDAYFRGQKINKAILGRDLLNLTKELITFAIDEIEYQAEKGMTFGEWTNSSYHTGNFYIDETENYYLKPSGSSIGYVYYTGSDGYWKNVNKDDIINPEEYYFISK